MHSNAVILLLCLCVFSCWIGDFPAKSTGSPLVKKPASLSRVGSITSPAARKVRRHASQGQGLWANLSLGDRGCVWDPESAVLECATLAEAQQIGIKRHVRHMNLLSVLPITKLFKLCDTSEWTELETVGVTSIYISAMACSQRDRFLQLDNCAINWSFVQCSITSVQQTTAFLTAGDISSSGTATTMRPTQSTSTARRTISASSSPGTPTAEVNRNVNTRGLPTQAASSVSKQTTTNGMKTQTSAQRSFSSTSTVVTLPAIESTSSVVGPATELPSGESVPSLQKSATKYYKSRGFHWDAANTGAIVLTWVLVAIFFYKFKQLSYLVEAAVTNRFQQRRANLEIREMAFPCEFRESFRGGNAGRIYEPSETGL